MPITTDSNNSFNHHAFASNSLNKFALNDTNSMSIDSFNKRLINEDTMIDILRSNIT